MKLLKALDVRDMLGVGGFVSLIYGIACVSGPAAWIVGGMLALVVAAAPVLLNRRKQS